jgi:FKBP-type peptidyl-prolyl cis-trans isomerase
MGQVFKNMNNKSKGVVIAVSVLIVFIFIGWTGGIFDPIFRGTNNNQQVSQNIDQNASNTINQINNVDNSKLGIKDEVVGTGAEAVSGKNITVNYVGIFTDGTKFDSSIDRGTPFTFTLGARQVIQGWDLGVQGMKVGGKRILVVPPELGYGANAYGPIPANSTLVFEIELLKVE